jgi:hypothetical protein
LKQLVADPLLDVTDRVEPASRIGFQTSHFEEPTVCRRDFSESMMSRFRVVRHGKPTQDGCGACDNQTTSRRPSRRRTGTTPMCIRRSSRFVSTAVRSSCRPGPGRLGTRVRSTKAEIQKDSVGRIRPVWPARPAAARFRRACVGPILVRPPIRVIQPCARPQSADSAITSSLAW